MKKLSLILCTILLLVSFVSTSFAQRGHGRMGNCSGTCPRLNQQSNIQRNQSTSNYNNFNNQNNNNRPRNQYNPNCPYRN